MNSWHYIGLGVCIAAVIGAGLLLSSDQMQFLWVVTATAMVVFIMMISRGLTGRFWDGWLINEQNRMSLSRLQMVLWTVLILSAYFTAVIANIKNGYAEMALDIAIPQEIWVALGIATTSLVGSPLILDGKKDTKTNESGTQDTNNTAMGQLHRNQTLDQAKLSELVSGEELGNANILDISRLQNLFFTLILVGVYLVALNSMLGAVGAGTLIDQFPALSSSMVALLGISHAGYLAAKAVPKQTDGA